MAAVEADISDALKDVADLFKSMAQQLSSAGSAIQGFVVNVSPVANAVVALGQQLAGAISGIAGFVGKLSSVAMQVAQVMVDPFLKLTELILTPFTMLAGAIAGAVGSLLTFVGGIISAAFSAIMESTVVQSAVIPALVGLATSIGVALIPILAALAVVCAALAAVLVVVAAALAVLAAAVLAVAAIIAAPFVAAAMLLTTALTMLAAPLAATGIAAAAATGPFIALGAAAGAVTKPFEMLGNALGPFVEALNPSVMEAFNFALKGLKATIGVAFLPVIQVFTTAMRAVAGALLPLMQQMAPVLQALASALTGVLLVAVQTIADLFVSLMPIVSLFVDLFGALAEAFKVFLVVVRTLIQMVLGLFGGGDLKDISKQFRDALMSVVKYLVIFAAYLARLLGVGGDFISGLMKNLQQVINPPAGAAPAPSDVGIKGFESISKEMAVAAFGAQGGGGAAAPKEIDFLKDIKQALEEMSKRDPQAVVDKAIAQIKEWGEKQLQEILSEAKKGLSTKYEEAKSWLTDLFPKLPSGEKLEHGAAAAAAIALLGFGPPAALFGK